VEAPENRGSGDEEGEGERPAELSRCVRARAWAARASWAGGRARTGADDGGGVTSDRIGAELAEDRRVTLECATDRRAEACVAAAGQGGRRRRERAGEGRPVERGGLRARDLDGSSDRKRDGYVVGCQPSVGPASLLKTRRQVGSKGIAPRRRGPNKGSRRRGRAAQPSKKPSGANKQG
jgi:hypothetical protein